MANPVQGVSVINTTKQTTTLTAGKNTSSANVPMVGPAKANKGEFREKGLHEDWATYSKAKASYNFNKDLKSGTLKFVPATKFLGATFREQHYEYMTDKKTTLGDIKYRYNLPDGSLRSQSKGGGGDFDLHQAPEIVTIEEADMEKALGKKIFHAQVQD